MPTTAGTGNDFNFARAEKLLRYVYASKVEELAPESDKIAKDCDFSDSATKVGRKFLMPVEAARSMGATFNNTGSVFALNTSRAPDELQAEVLGSEILVRESMSYKMMTSAMSGDTNTKAGLKAFVQATSSTFKRLSKGGSYFREMALLYGGGSSATANLGVVLNTTGTATTSLVVQMAAANWCTAIWAGSEGGAFDIYSSAGTKRNTAGTGETSVFVLNSVDSVNYKLTFTSEAATNVAGVVATDQIFFEGARTKEALGFVAANSETTLWNIAVASYNLWKPQSVDVAGMATFESIMEGCVKVGDIGFTGTLKIHVNPATFKDINDDQVAMVRHSDAKGKVVVGFDDITYQGPTGQFKIIPNIYIKRGIAVGLPEGLCKRVGSTDLTYTMPGYGKMIRELDGYAGVEARIYSDQALFIERPAFSILYTGIVNSTD